MALRLAFTVSAIAGGFAKAMEDAQRPIAKAATAAVGDAAAIAKRDGRRDIAAAGLSRKWQNALRSKLFPPQGVSMRPAAIVYHRIPYASVFEEGAVIRGRPLLWLPTEHVPLRSGGRRMTPAQYARSIGPLVGIVSRSGTPLLVAEAPRQGPAPAPRCWIGRAAQAALCRRAGRGHRQAVRHRGRGGARLRAVAGALREAFRG